MPAVRDVGARFIAPACRHCALGDVRKLLPRAVAAGPFSFIHRGRGEKCRLVRPTAAVASCLPADALGKFQTLDHFGQVFAEVSEALGFRLLS